MTMTETRPEEAAPAAVPVAARPEPSGLAGWLTTGDHRRVGRLYVGFSLVFAVALLAVGALLGFEKIDSGDTQLLDADAVGQLFSLYRWGLALGVAAPLLLGLAIAIVPTQVGARSVAFPRAAALSFWAWVLGIGVMVGAFADNGGPGGGNSQAVDLFIAALVLVVAALCVGALCVATTVLTLRAPGMTLQRIPMAAWSGFAGSAVMLVSLPVLVGLSVLLYADHRYGRIVFGGNLQLGEWIDWALNPTQLYLYAVPALGMLADVTTTASRTRQPLRGVLTGFIGLAAILAFGANLQLAFSPELRGDFYYITVTLGSALAVLAVLVVSVGSMTARKPRITAATVFVLLGGLMLFVGLAAGAMTGYERLELVGPTYASDTAWSLGVFNYVLLGAVLLGMGAVCHWGPKLWGRRLPEGAAIGLAVVGFLAVVLVSFPDLVSGLLDQPAYAVDFDVDGPSELLNALSAAGYVLMAVVVVAFGLLMVRGFTRGASAGDDPWDGQTLEWATSSPPPPGTFDDLPVVTSPEPLFDRKEA